MNIITLGTFDLLHIGHLKLFKRCKKLSNEDNFIVGLNSDEFIQKYKGKRPIMTFDERYRIIQETEIADNIVINNQSDGSIKTLLIEQKIDLIVIGSDWFKKDYLSQIGLTIEWMEKNDISLCYVPYTEGISTTEIKKRMGI